MEKAIFVSDIKNLKTGVILTTPLLILDQDAGVTVKGTTFLSLTLSDKTGTIKGKVWDDTDALGRILQPGSVRLVTGKTDKFRSLPQLSVTAAQELPDGEYDIFDFVKGPKLSLDKLKESLFLLIESIEDADFRSFLKTTLARPEVKSFFGMAAAKRMHHAYPGGLIEHSLSVAKTARLIASHYEESLNRDLLVTGAILHDVGKCWEFSDDLHPEYTTAGKLMGHIFMGASFLGQVASGLPGFPKDKLLLLQHLILSHHGQRDKGSPITPKIAEGLALHYLDDLDAKLNSISTLITGLEDQEPMTAWTPYNQKDETTYLKTPTWEEDKKPEDRAYGGDSDPFLEPSRRKAWTELGQDLTGDLGPSFDPREPRAPRHPPLAPQEVRQETEKQFDRVRKFFAPSDGRAPGQESEAGPAETIPEPEMERLRRSVSQLEGQASPQAGQASQASHAGQALSQEAPPKPKRPSLF